MTAELTVQAQHRLDRYLGQVRILLRGATNLDADEVERDIREHVAVALGSAKGPVSEESMIAVLERLGRPSQWLGEEEIPPWRRVLARLQTAEDWRLSYACLASTALGFLFLFAGSPVALAFFAGGFFLARAAVSLAEERDEALGPQRWLVLPAIAVVVVPVLVVLVVGPLHGALQVAYEQGGLAGLGFGPSGLEPLPREAAIRTALIGLGSGVWWLLLAGFWRVCQRALAAFARPIYAPRPAHRRVLAVAGAALTVISAVLLVLIARGVLFAGLAPPLIVT